MKTATRAHRILSSLTSFQKAGAPDDWPSKLSSDGLGEAVGYYQNPEPQDGLIGVFTEGLAWVDDGGLVEARFVDISEVRLPEGKGSKSLLLHLRNNKQLELPIRGQRGRFFDSLEMLRFLDRVLRDLS